jgi:nucleoside-diphosphate-sugar epimerase
LATIIVTGAAGFIGSHVSSALRERGDTVVGIDNFDPFYDAALKRENQRRARLSELVEADICDADAMRSVLARVRPAGVIHLAAKAGVRPSLRDPVGYARTNVMGTQVLLRRGVAGRVRALRDGFEQLRLREQPQGPVCGGGPGG